MRIFSALLALSALLLSESAAKPPNIVFIIADDLGWGDVGYHGSRIKTPHIDRLAKRGVELDQFYVQPVCSPTRGALMTGRYPMRLGLQCGVVRPWATHGLPLDEQTLPAELKKAGYATDLIGAEAVQIIAEHDEAKPLFLYVPFNAPHTPLQAPEDQIARNSDHKQKNRRVYAAMVTSMDDAIGRILDAADGHLPAEETIIFFCSDNGGVAKLGSNGGLRAGKGTLYEGGVRVPAIMAWKGKLEAGKVFGEPLHVVDIYPTLLGIAGADVDQAKPLDGKDLWPTIAKGKTSPHDFILLNATPFHGAVRMGDWKLVHNGRTTANTTSPKGPETWELFNLAEDPREKTDLSGEKPEVLARLKRKLAKLEAEAVEPNIPPNLAPADFVVPEVWGERRQP